MNIYAKLGAVVYVLWGLFHIQAARLVYVLGQSMEPGIIQGRVYQDAWNLLFFALFGIAVQHRVTSLQSRHNKHGLRLCCRVFGLPFRLQNMCIQFRDRVSNGFYEVGFGRAGHG